MIEEQDSGCTNPSKEFIIENILQVGTPQKVILSNKHFFPGTQRLGYSVDVVGDQETLRVHGFTWGYGGKGPHGTLWLLQDVLDQDIDITKIAQIPMDIPEFTIDLDPKQINEYFKGVLMARSCFDCPCLVEDEAGKYCYHKCVSPAEIKTCDKKRILMDFKKMWWEDLFAMKIKRSD